MIFESPEFWLFVAAALILGVAKAGFGGVGTILAVPIATLASPPGVALGVLLPILLAIDLLNVIGHWRAFDGKAVLQAVPGSLIGVAIGGYVLTSVNGDAIALLIGVLAIVFAVRSLTQGTMKSGRLGAPKLVSIFGIISGFTSTVAHAGGPPIHIHFLSRGYTPLAFVATSSIFLASVNVMKIGPYVFAGHLGREQLMTSAALIPFAAVAAIFGIWLARRISKRAFSITINILMIVVGVKLISDSIAALI